MSKVYETLKKKNDTSVEVYPNIERTNIPDGAINTAKIEDRAVTYNKLSDALQDDITHFRNIYDADDDKLDVSGLNVGDDIYCTNIDVDNKVTADDIEVTNNLEVANEILLNGDNVYALFNHSINVNLQERNDVNVVTFSILFVSSNKNAITNFTELFNELSNKENLPFYDLSNDIMGILTDVNVDGYISIYCSDGNGGLTEKDFDVLTSITDNVNPI